MEKVKIPSHFAIIQNREYVLELQSKYHFWRITQGDKFFILAHKYRISDAYHKQRIATDPQALIRYIVCHDNVFERRLKS